MYKVEIKTKKVGAFQVEPEYYDYHYLMIFSWAPLGVSSMA